MSLTIDLNNTNKSSSIFNNLCSNVSFDKQINEKNILIVIDDDEDDDIEIEETINHKEQDETIFRNLISKLDQDTELIVVQSNSSIRICTSALTYSNLLDSHIILVNYSLMPSPECLHKRHLYINKPDLLVSLPIRTRIYNYSLSRFGFIIEKPCSNKNLNRYLIIYDNYTACYHLKTDFYLCLCQDFQKHLLNIDCIELRSYYQYTFQHIHKKKLFNWTIGTIIRVKKFGTQYHNARIIDKDCSIIKICFFERKSQPIIWIHSNSSIIDSIKDLSSSKNLISIDDIIISDTDLLNLRKRKNNINHINEGRKKLRDRSNKTQIQNSQQQLSSNDETIILSSRANMLTAYYTDILLPKFRILNNLPYIPHKCNQQCILLSEENFQSNQIYINPFLLPFECKWSIIDGRPRGYRTPCQRTFYNLDDIEKYLYETKSKLSIKFFIDDLLTRFKPSINKFEQKYIIMNDLSYGLENISISVYNNLDNDKPNNFTYITKIRPYDHRISLTFNDTNMTSCCNCLDNCNDRMKCACFLKTLNQALINHDPLILEKQKYRYSVSHIMKTIGYQRKRLLNPISSGIYECNSKCSCHIEHCSNRLVQHGLFVQLQLFKDKNKGWALRTLHDLPRGTFICQYIGELITSDQGHERAQTMDDRYQTSLDLVKQIYYDNEIDDDDDDEPYVIDGNLFGNLGKYFNHSCDPNMYIQNVFIESHDLHFPNLALFTHTRVKAGEELTWHYNCELLPDREVKCYCGSKNCRGRLL